MIPYEDRAYVAGFFDGEGCVTCQRTGSPAKKSRLFYVTVSLTQKSPAVLSWVQVKYGGRISRNARGIHRLRITGRLAVERFLLDIGPYTKVKKSQIQVALELIRSRESGEHASKSRELKALKYV